MKKAKWDYVEAEEIRKDIFEAYIGAIHEVMETTPDDLEKSLKMEGMRDVYSRIINFTEVQKDENIQNS